jgi:hypothetical protein
LTVLLAPAAALPALLPRLLVALPVVPIDDPVVPPIDDPVVVPVAPGLAAVPPAEPAPLCASANVLVSANTPAKPIVANFMIIVLRLLATTGQRTAARDVPELMRL